MADLIKFREIAERVRKNALEVRFLARAAAIKSQTKTEEHESEANPCE